MSSYIPFPFNRRRGLIEAQGCWRLLYELDWPWDPGMLGNHWGRVPFSGKGLGSLEEGYGGVPTSWRSGLEIPGFGQGDWRGPFRVISGGKGGVLIRFILLSLCSLSLGVVPGTSGSMRVGAGGGGLLRSGSA